MGTTLTYNQIVMTDVVMREFSQEAVYDGTNTDILHHRFKISVIAVLHPSFVGSYGSTIVDSQSMAGAFITLQNKLLEKGKELKIEIGGQVILESSGFVTATSPGTDVNNGPRPTMARVTQLAGDRLMRVQFDVETSIIRCENVVANQGVISNRWSTSDDIDQNLFTTRIVRGRLRIANSSLNPHAFRGWVVPPLQPGFQRASMAFLVDLTGLELDYTITDVQKAFAPPGGATNWSCTHTASTPDGVNTFAEINVELEGPPTASKTDLLVTCARIVLAKLGVASLTTHELLIEQASITDHVHENKVAMNVRARFQNPTKTIFNITNPGQVIGEPLQIEGYDRFQNPNPGPYGEASPIGLFISHLQSPCDNNHRMPQTQEISPEESEATTGDGPRLSVETGVLPQGQEVYSSEHLEKIYTYYEIQSEYETNRLLMGLPIAKTTGSAASEDPSTMRTAAIIKLSNGPGVTRRTVTIKAERVGDWPTFPAPADYVESGSNLAYLLNDKITPDAPRLSADGATYVFQATAVYEYQLLRPPSVDEGLRSGYRPLQSGEVKTLMPGTSFVPGLI